MPAYQYQPLQAPDSIRLVILQPSAFEESPILCDLIHVRLSDVPQNEALSYTWGDTTLRDAHTAYLNDAGEALGIGFNCLEAIRHLRYPETSRVLWIDAICIDQEGN